MKLERLDFKELEFGAQIKNAAVTGKVFLPSHTRKIEPPAPPPPPTFSEEEMMLAEREGYKKGFAAGEIEGRKQAENQQAEINNQLVAMIDTFTSSVAPIFDHYRTMTLDLQKDIPNVALAIARKVAGESLQANAEAVVCDIAMKACETMISEPELTIVAHESFADTLENKLQELAQRLPAATRIIIVRDPDMPKADCRIEWHNGSLERVTTNLWQHVEKAIGNMQVIGKREATDQLEELQAKVLTSNETSGSEKE